MKELQVANENKQQELEAVRKVGVDGPQSGSHFTAGATAALSTSFGSAKTS